MLLKTISPCYPHSGHLFKHSCSTILRRCCHGLVKRTQQVNAILTKIDNDLKDGARMDFSSVLSHMNGVHRNWPEALGGEQQLLASVTNGLLQQRSHSEIDNLVQCLDEQGYVYYEGMATTIMKSYIHRRDWKKAVDWFEGRMKTKTIEKHGLVKEGTMRHLRLYNLLITSLARDGLTKLAYHYFKEVDELEYFMFSHRRWKPLTDSTLKALLQCLFDMQHGDTYDHSDLYMKTILNKTIQNKTKDLTPEDLFDSIIDYIDKWSLPIQEDLMNMISPILKTFKGYNVNYTTQVNNTCLNCNADLAAVPNFSPICNKVVSNIRDFMLDQELSQHIQQMDDFVEAEGDYFDVVIDAANALSLSEDSRTKNSHLVEDGNDVIPPTRRLNNLLFSIRAHCRPRKVVLVLNRRWGNQKSLIEFLAYVKDKNWFDFQLSEFIINSTVCDAFNDDIATLYLSAKSDISLEQQDRSVNIVTNDVFRDHRYFAGFDQKDFFLWLRHRNLKFNKRKGYNYVPQTIVPPIVRMANQNTHLISKAGSVCCIGKT